MIELASNVDQALNHPFLLSNFDEEITHEALLWQKADLEIIQ